MGVERLGRYSVLKHLASGGMADVLLGRTDGIEGFERHVVLKRIRAEHAQDQRFISMFLDEARVAASLHHQNIVQVFDIGEENGAYFFAMEYLHGEDLRRLLSAVSKTKSHMPLGYVVAIVAAAAAGLHYAHERKSNDKKALHIVHRDVSPSNIFIGYDGAVKVVDFGIAKARTHQGETQTGSLKGKVSYMSPEQCKGEEIDRRSDVYALGVLLYELATTTRLFKGDNDYLMMDAIVNGKVPLPRVRRPDLPNDLSMIILRALSVDKARRYQSADELRVDLEQFAIKAGLTTTMSALATYMRKMFGEKPEPWLYDGPLKTGISGVDVDGPTAAAGSSGASWSDPGRDEFALTPEEEAARHATDKTQSERKPARQSARNILAASAAVAPPAPRDTRSSMGLGWERLPTAPRSHRLLWFSLPIVLTVAGLSVWQFVLKPQQATKSAAATQPPAMTAAVAPQPPAPGPTVEPIATPEPTARVAEPSEPAAAPVEPAAAEPVAAEPEPAPVPTKKTHAAPTRRATTRKEPEKVVAAVVPAPTPAPAPAPAVVTPPTPAPAPAPVPVPAVAKQPDPPKEVELTISSLSNATVSAVASDNSRSLGKCEGGAELHGDVAVSFQIDGTGRVIKSQLSSSIKNPKVAGCILKAVQSWKFPKPPSGAAKGVYTISYQ